MNKRTGNTYSKVSRRDFIAKTALAGAGITLTSSFKKPTAHHTTQHILLGSGWATRNIGDIGHTPGTLRYLTQNIPGAKVTLLLKSYNDAIVSMIKTRFPRVDIIKEDADHTDQLEQAFERADMFIQNSGMKFNRFWKPPVEIIKRSIGANVPFCLYGQSFDGFEKEKEAEMSALLSRASQVYCRENESYFYLRKIGVQPGVLEFGPDGCFGIDVLDEEKAEAYLQANGLRPKEYITVTLRTNTPTTGYSNVLNPGQPTSEEKLQDEFWAGKLRSLIEHWVKETGLKVLLAPEVDKEILHARRLLFDKLPLEIQKYIVHRDTFWNVDEAASIYARAHTVVSMEPHSCIIALANGTPALHLFSPKHGVKAWMFRDIGLPEWLHNIDTDPVNQFSRALMQIYGHYPQAEKKVDRAMSFVHHRSVEMMNRITKTITG